MNHWIEVGISNKIQLTNEWIKSSIPNDRKNNLVGGIYTMIAYLKMNNWQAIAKHTSLHLYDIDAHGRVLGEKFELVKAEENLLQEWIDYRFILDELGSWRVDLDVLLDKEEISSAQLFDEAHRPRIRKIISDHFCKNGRQVMGNLIKITSSNNDKVNVRMEPHEAIKNSLMEIYGEISEETWGECVDKYKKMYPSSCKVRLAEPIVGEKQ